MIELRIEAEDVDDATDLVMRILEHNESAFTGHSGGISARVYGAWFAQLLESSADEAVDDGEEDDRWNR